MHPDRKQRAQSNLERERGIDVFYTPAARMKVDMIVTNSGRRQKNLPVSPCNNHVGPAFLLQVIAPGISYEYIN